MNPSFKPPPISAVLAEPQTVQYSQTLQNIQYQSKTHHCYSTIEEPREKLDKGY